MECPHCKFVVSPGVEAVEGTCPNCDRPYRGQPSPTESDMTMRNMPEPGMDDSGGNPLQEGILGDYQNRGVRDESFASVHSHNLNFANARSHVHDPLFHERTGAPLALLPAAEEAGAVGLGEGAAGGGLLEGASGLLGRIPGGGAIKGLLGLGGDAGAATEGTAAGETASPGAIGSIMNKVKGLAPGWGLHSLMFGSPGIMGEGMGSPQTVGAPSGQVMPPTYYSSVEEDDLFPGSHGEPPADDTDDPEGVDPKEKNQDQRDKDLQVGMGVDDIGGTDEGQQGLFGSDSHALTQFADLLPLLLGHMVGGTGADDPFVQQLHEALDAEVPGYDQNPDDDAGQALMGSILGLGGEGDADDPLLEDNEAPHDPIKSSVQHPVRTFIAQRSGVPAGEAQVRVAGNVAEIYYLWTHPSRRRRGVASSLVSRIRDAYPDHTIATTTNEMSGPLFAKFATQPGARVRGRLFTWAGVSPQVMNTCMRCGGAMDPSSKSCPQCGFGNMSGTPQNVNTNQEAIAPDGSGQMQASIRTADGQGPNNDPQKEMVAELLLQEGRAEEIPDMIANPQNYAKELAAIQQQAPPPGAPDEPPPPPSPPMAPGGPPPGGPPPGPPGGAGAMPMAAAMNRAAFREAIRLGFTVDPLTGACPNCGGHSTGIVDEDGTAACKSCHHKFKKEDNAPATDPKLKDGSVHEADDSQEVNSPAADLMHQRNIEDENDSSGFWQDADGNKLIEGQVYKLKIPGVEIPDYIRITKIPSADTLNALVISEFGMDAPIEIKRNEAQVEGYEFEHAPEPTNEHQDDPGFEENRDDRQPGRPEPGQDTDLSTPHELMASREAAAAIDGPGPDWLKDEIVKEGGAHYTPMEERAFIDEEGSARNADKLNLSGTHYEMDEDPLEVSFLW